MRTNCRRKLVVFTMATITLGAAQSSAAPICTPNMDPLKCGEAQLAEAASLLAQYKSEVARLDGELRRVAQGLSPDFVKFVKGEPLKDMVNNKWNTAKAKCDEGYVAIGGVCDGSPVGVVHPMTKFEDRRTFVCNFHLNAHDGDKNRELIATVACLKERAN